MPSQPLVSATELASRLGDPDTVVVDCRFSLLAPGAGREAYLAGHIPTARYAHLDDDLARKPSRHEGRHPLPDPADFARTVGKWGIGNGTDVVVYDDQGGAIAARLWWMLRWVGHDDVTVLDGGLQAWAADGGALVGGPEPAPTAREFRIRKLRADWVATTADIEALADSSSLLVDARSASRFAGREEPIDPVAGHVPGALNWPFGENLAADGRFRSPSEIAALLERLPARPDSQLIAMCGSGVTACHLLLALALLDREGRLYAGSWSEWIRDPSRPVATA